jgi:hypothetical protein
LGLVCRVTYRFIIDLAQNFIFRKNPSRFIRHKCNKIIIAIFFGNGIKKIKELFSKTPKGTDFTSANFYDQEFIVIQEKIVTALE